MTDRLGLARAVALLAPVALLGGALISQYWGGLFPCEMCYWQRWPHMAAIGLALLAILLRRTAGAKPLLALAAIAILISGLIGGFHAGVEYGWWEGLTQCSTTMASGDRSTILARIMAAPIIRCDVAQWELAGISLAGFNFIFSTGTALLILALMAKGRKV
ncbi:disulfide bond formation protein B [Sphingobium boeckii]|uniref:Disulfide bond formation protein DsbB n=1 Tax=Sphingobium boeckii TaxID=1082345 RepID=A0A7W9AIH3_9SPHN|nr:disulfide bond formation protein B [Sphingobium boeckii]MBB5686111.1 disulfide bond formation protein DsbB [Sphingobium boeckii]